MKKGLFILALCFLFVWAAVPGGCSTPSVSSHVPHSARDVTVRLVPDDTLPQNMNLGGARLTIYYRGNTATAVEELKLGNLNGEVYTPKTGERVFQRPDEYFVVVLDLGTLPDGTELVGEEILLISPDMDEGCFVLTRTYGAGDPWADAAGQRMSASSPSGGYCTPTPGDWNGNGSNEEVLLILLAVAALAALWMWFRWKK